MSYGNRGWEETRVLAMRSTPFQKKYFSAKPCKRHGATPTRYTNTELCVDCSKEKSARYRPPRWLPKYWEKLRDTSKPEWDDLP